MYTKILAHVRDNVRQFYGNCRTLLKPHITEKRRKKAKYLASNSTRLKFVKRPACQTLWKALEMRKKGRFL